MTAWLICFNVFVLHGLVGCNLTTSTALLDDTSATQPKDTAKTSHPHKLPILSMHPTEEEEQNFYKALQEQKIHEARRFYYVKFTGWPNDDSFAVRFKQAADQVYFLQYNVSTLCAKHLRHISEGIYRGDLWALAFLDSNGKADTSEAFNNAMIMGSKEQCERIIVLGEDQDLIEGRYIKWESMFPENNERDFKFYTAWHFCLPKSCTDVDHDVMATTFNSTWGLWPLSIRSSKLFVTPRDRWYWASVVTLSTLACICLLATCIDCLYTYCLSLPSLDNQILTTEDEEVEENIFKQDEVIKEKKLECRGSNRMLQAFSLRQNLSDILKTSCAEGDIGCLHGLRVLSMMWVICGHVSNSLPELLDSNEYFYLTPGSFLIIAYSAPYAVDTFFLMSGCLVSYLFIGTVNRVGQLKAMHMVMYYIHRYIRLTPFYIIVIMIYAGLLPDFFSKKHQAYQYKKECAKYWWRNILYINNFYDYDDICLGWSWYLSNDMQFYVIAPVVIIPIIFGFYKVGLSVAFSMLLCHIGASTYVLEVVRIRKSQDFDYLTDFYCKPWNRIGPYAIGLVLGYFLSVRKTELKIRKPLILLGWLSYIAVSVGLVLVDNYNAKKDATIEPNLTTVQLRIQEIVKRPLWGFCLTWLIINCNFGHGGLLTRFLTWRAWIPLSKLTYGAYLCHKLVIIFFDETSEYGMELNYFVIIERLLYVTILTYIMSLILCLLIELPTRNLLNTFQQSAENDALYRLVKSEGVESKVKTVQ